MATDIRTRKVSDDHSPIHPGYTSVIRSALPPGAPLDSLIPAHLRLPPGAPWPDISAVVTQDDEPVDSWYAEKQMRLLTEALYSSWAGPGGGRPFAALSNVGLFFQHKKPPLVPDVMLALDVQLELSEEKKENRSYFLWVVGKPPDVVVEIISDRRGNEDTGKLLNYAHAGVPYYVLIDRRKKLGTDVLEAYELKKGVYHPIDPSWFPDVGLGMCLWEGSYEREKDVWVRWCNERGKLIPTGKEGIDAEKKRARAASKRADAERQRADAERQRADAEKQRAARLAAKLRELGIDPDA